MPPLAARRPLGAWVVAGLVVLAVVALRARTTPREGPPASAREVLARASSLAATDSARAADLAVEAARLAGGDPATTTAAASVLLRAGSAARARSVLLAGTPSLAAAPREVRLPYARLLRQTGEREAALEIARATEGGALPLGVALLLELDRTDEALAIAGKAAGEGPPAARVAAAVSTGEARLARGELALAREAFLDALALDERSGAAAAGLVEVLLRIGAREDALGPAGRAVAVEPAEAWVFHARAAARLLNQDVAGAIADISAASRLESDHACLEGRRLAAALTSGTPAGIWARALVREARRAASDVIEVRVPEVVAVATRASEAATGAFPASASAHTSRGLARFFRGEADGAFESAETAHALGPADRVDEVLRTYAMLALRRPVAEASAVLEAAAPLPDVELETSGLASPIAAPEVVGFLRADLLLGLENPAAARDLLDPLLARPARPSSQLATVTQLARAAERLQALDLAGLVRLREHLEPGCLEGRVFAWKDQVDVAAAADAAVLDVPWQPALRVVRGSILARPVEARLLDQVTAACLDGGYTLRGLIPFLQDGGNADPEHATFPPHLLPGDDAATPLTRALLALLAPSKPPERARDAIRALGWIDEAEGVRSTIPLIHALRALALGRVDAPLAAARETASFVAHVPAPVAEGFLTIRATLAKDGPAAAEHLAKLQTAAAAEARDSKNLVLEDLAGAETVLDLVSRGTAAPIEHPDSVDVFVPSAAPGWRSVNDDGERAVEVSGTAVEPFVLDDLECDALEVEVDGGPGCGPLRVTVDGEPTEIALASRPARTSVFVAAGLPVGRKHRVELASGGGRVKLWCLYRHRLPPPERVAERREHRLAVLGHVLGRATRPGDAEDLLRLRGSPREVARHALASKEVWAQAGESPGRLVALGFDRLLGRQPTEDEVAKWTVWLAKGDREGFARILSRSDEFRP